MPHRVILQHELAGERRVAIERHRRGAIQLFIAESADRGSRRSAVGFQQRKRGFFRGRVMLLCMVAVYVSDNVPGHAGNGLARGEQARQMDFDGIHAGNVMHYDADLASVLGEARVPLCFGQGARKGGECGGAASRRAARASDLLFIIPPPSRQTETVTRRNVAGMETPLLLLWFCAFAKSKSCLRSSSAFPFFSAASNAFMVGP
jgi:hypothetical protein